MGQERHQKEKEREKWQINLLPPTSCLSISLLVTHSEYIFCCLYKYAFASVCIHVSAQAHVCLCDTCTFVCTFTIFGYFHVFVYVVSGCPQMEVLRCVHVRDICG